MTTRVSAATPLRSSAQAQPPHPAGASGSDPTHRPTRANTPPPPGLRTIASSELLADQACVLIAHAGQHYRLQATRQGKLILTK